MCIYLSIYIYIYTHATSANELYNDFNELVAVGQLSHPVKNDDELSIGINVRFDA